MKLQETQDPKISFAVTSLEACNFVFFAKEMKVSFSFPTQGHWEVERSKERELSKRFKIN